MHYIRKTLWMDRTDRLNVVQRMGHTVGLVSTMIICILRG